jgi:salicylate 5-hydroxylase large subunit
MKNPIWPNNQVNYSLVGKLLGVPFQRGVKGQGGMPADFSLEDRTPTQLQVADEI